MEEAEFCSGCAVFQALSGDCERFAFVPALPQMKIVYKNELNKAKLAAGKMTFNAED
jgi:hypothetical protein